MDTPIDSNAVTNTIQGLISIVTLLGVGATAILAHLAKRKAEQSNNNSKVNQALLKINTDETLIIKDAVNGQRQALENRISILEAKLENAVKTATDLALSQAAVATAIEKPKL